MTRHLRDCASALAMIAAIDDNLRVRFPLQRH